ncbi:MAG TPA: SCO family protein [Oxalicibacterium sp.]|nr:SCO family protein [Oxalicibacterium sp.]
MMQLRFRTAAVLCAALLALAACGDKSAAPQAFENTDITGLNYAKDFSLYDFNGKPRTLADFRGKAVVVFFGFTQCPDVCPTTMVEMAQAMKALGSDADKVQVLFVTLDPERDTAEVLRQYVPAFDSRFLGLRGDAEQTKKVAQEFKVFYQKVPGQTAGSYTLDHTAGTYVFDPQGRVRLFIRYGQPVEPIVHDLKILLS